MPLIQILATKEQNNFADFKTENFKLKKEIVELEKGKIELQNAIYACLGKLYKLEKEVGIKAKAYVYGFDSTLNDNGINAKVIIMDEDI